MKKRFATLVIMCAVALIAHPAQGATFTWTNDAFGDTDWGTADNWEGPVNQVPDSDDTAIIAVASGYPTSSSNRTVKVLTIKDGAELTVTGFDLTTDVLTIEGNAKLSVTTNKLEIVGRHGLTIQNNGELSITSGGVKLYHGGTIDLDGTIIFEGGGGTLQLQKDTAHVGSSVYVIPASATGKIVGDGTNQGKIASFPRGPAVLVVGAGVELLGKLNIDVTLVNNGLVHADREGELLLECNSKAGNGRWKVSTHVDAKMVSRASIAGGPDSIIEIENGVFNVRSDWVSCGSVWMLQNAGKIEVERFGTLRTGTGTGECVCGG